MRCRPSRHSPAGQLGQQRDLTRFEVEGVLAVLLHGHTVPLVHRDGGRLVGSIGRPPWHNGADGKAGRLGVWVPSAPQEPPHGAGTHRLLSLPTRPETATQSRPERLPATVWTPRSHPAAATFPHPASPTGSTPSGHSASSGGDPCYDAERPRMVRGPGGTGTPGWRPQRLISHGRTLPPVNSPPYEGNAPWPSGGKSSRQPQPLLTRSAPRLRIGHGLGGHCGRLWRDPLPMSNIASVQADVRLPFCLHCGCSVAPWPTGGRL